MNAATLEEVLRQAASRALALEIPLDRAPVYLRVDEAVLGGLQVNGIELTHPNLGRATFSRWCARGGTMGAVYAFRLSDVHASLYAIRRDSIELDGISRA